MVTVAVRALGWPGGRGQGLRGTHLCRAHLLRQRLQQGHRLVGLRRQLRRASEHRALLLLELLAPPRRLRHAVIHLHSPRRGLPVNGAARGILGPRHSRSAPSPHAAGAGRAGLVGPPICYHTAPTCSAVASSL